MSSIAILGLGAIQEIRFAIGTAASQSSVEDIPANVPIIYAAVDVETGYSPGTTIQVGIAGTPNLLMDTTDSVPTSTVTFEAPQAKTVWPATDPVLVTVGGAPVAGSGFCVVRYVAKPQA